jgi:hypothetical protein
MFFGTIAHYEVRSNRGRSNQAEKVTVEIPDKRTFSVSLLFLASGALFLLIRYLLFVLRSLSQNDPCVST